MEKVYIMELKKDSKYYSAIGQMELARVPVAGDKLFIVHDKYGDNITTYVYNVVDVHFADKCIPDVCVINIAEREDYLQSLVATHTLK